MNRKHILINGEKLNIKNWAKWLILIAAYVLSMLVILIIENLISKTLNIPLEKIYTITFYIRGFIVLSLIHDLAPKFRKIISGIWSICLAFIYLSYDKYNGDTLYIKTLVFIIIIIAFNIFIYRMPKNRNQSEE